MGLGTNILLFMVILNIVFYIIRIDTPMSLLLSSFLSLERDTNKVQVNNNLVLSILAVAATSSILATGLGLVPNISFAALITFLLTFATFPISVFNSIQTPFEIKLITGGVLSVLYLLALISFSRGGDL